MWLYNCNLKNIWVIWNIGFRLILLCSLLPRAIISPLLTFHLLYVSCTFHLALAHFVLLLFHRLRKQQYEWWHVQRWLSYYCQHRLFICVHQDNERQVQSLPRYDMASDGRAAALLPGFLLWCHTREGHPGCHHGEWENALGGFISNCLFHSPSTHRGIFEKLFLPEVQYFVGWGSLVTSDYSPKMFLLSVCGNLRVFVKAHLFSHLVPTENSLPLTTAALVYGTVQPSRGNLLSVTAGFFQTLENMITGTKQGSVNENHQHTQIFQIIYRFIYSCKQ